MDNTLVTYEPADYAFSLGDTAFPFGWEGIPGSWPRRLLHIPTMTSLERREGNFYGRWKEPQYGILTYTWGRWQRKDGPRLGILGTSWTIPAVDEEHFTTQSFERIIKRMGEDVEFAWLDVACIDQENDTVKMDEIRKQVSIFTTAHRVYVWLSRLPTNTLTTALDDVFRCETHLYDDDTRALGKSLPDVLTDLLHSLDTIFRDPWFTSLWTLQEGTLRRDALVLSREGDTVPVALIPKLNVYLGFLLNAFFHLRTAIAGHLSRKEWNIEVEPLSNKIVNLIRNAGYDHAPFCQNPNIQYGAANRRITSFPLDRIYGITAIYGIQIGDHANSVCTFEELEYEFAAAINKYSPRLGQMFVHTHQPDEGCTWKITQRSRVPNELETFNRDLLDTCTIIPGSRKSASFEGPTCSFASLLKVWLSRKLDTYEDSDYIYPARIRVDDYLPDMYPSLPRLLGGAFDNEEQGLEAYLPLADALLKTFEPVKLLVLRLGEYRKTPQDRFMVGLVLLSSGASEAGYQRLGLCTWLDETFNGVEDPEWEHQHGRIY
ncbi:hypothetical protein BDV96DRAFT_561298 [Lophiotrema nucula]|uniref:Heterokaryon incompatibility domain-containing protein n=1 Tax=Lophiotrema nucula TaxID=690887 RepID=A0A6A5ZSU7_9PLEO|nr:hypothetical protein BDV96DRAFT_561298 [Lophiotrema nucula]